MQQHVGGRPLCVAARRLRRSRHALDPCPSAAPPTPRACRSTQAQPWWRGSRAWRPCAARSAPPPTAANQAAPAPAPSPRCRRPPRSAPLTGSCARTGASSVASRGWPVQCKRDEAAGIAPAADMPPAAPSTAALPAGTTAGDPLTASWACACRCRLAVASRARPAARPVCTAARAAATPAAPGAPAARSSAAAGAVCRAPASASGGRASPRTAAARAPPAAATRTTAGEMTVRAASRCRCRCRCCCRCCS